MEGGRPGGRLTVWFCLAMVPNGASHLSLRAAMRLQHHKRQAEGLGAALAAALAIELDWRAWD
jgi:hypothetical protein